MTLNTILEYYFIPCQCQPEPQTEHSNDLSDTENMHILSSNDYELIFENFKNILNYISSKTSFLLCFWLHFSEVTKPAYRPSSSDKRKEITRSQLLLVFSKKFKTFSQSMVFVC
jgi:hypothetical protein